MVRPEATRRQIVGKHREISLSKVPGQQNRKNGGEVREPQNVAYGSHVAQQCASGPTSGAQGAVKLVFVLPARRRPRMDSVRPRSRDVCVNNGTRRCYGACGRLGDAARAENQDPHVDMQLGPIRGSCPIEVGFGHSWTTRPCQNGRRPEGQPKEFDIGRRAAAAVAIPPKP